MDEIKHYPKKGHTPKRNHPWKNAVKSDVAKWAKEKNDQSKPHTFKFGQLKGLKR